MRLRTPLFAPADSERKCARAIASAADCVIVDLEDSVAEAAKVGARATAAVAVRRAPSGRDVVVRVNPRGTVFHIGDLAAIVPAAPRALMLPKCAGPDDLAALDRQLEALEEANGLTAGCIGVIALVTETAASVMALADYRHGVPARVMALCFGAEDLSADLGISPRLASGAYPSPIAHARDATLIAAASIGLPAIDTPFPDPRDLAGLAREAAAAADDGFAGKLLIHPDQIDPVVAAFTPSADRLAWARAVRDAFAAAPGSGVLTLDGKMLDRPHLRLAKRLLSAGHEPP